MKALTFIFVMALLASFVMFSANPPPADTKSAEPMIAVANQNAASPVFLKGEIIIIPTMLWLIPNSHQSQLQATMATDRSGTIYSGSSIGDIPVNTSKAFKGREVGIYSPKIVRQLRIIST